MNEEERTRIEQMAGDYGYIGEVIETNYIGQGDEFDFGGQRTFAGEKKTGRDFGFKIQNKHTEDVQIAICPALFDNTAALVDYGFTGVAGILTDGVIATIGANKVIGTPLDSTKKIKSLLSFVKRNPTRIVKMIMKATSTDQFEKDIRIENVAPFNKLGDQNIQLTDYFAPNQLNSTKIDMDLLETGKVIDFNDQNVVILTVAADTTVTINLKAGAILNHAAKLAKKAQKAYSNLSRVRR